MNGKSFSEDELYKQRKKMVENQIKRRGIKDEKVLDAFMNVPRHKFVPEHLKKNSYEDHPLPIGEGQTISQPYIVAEMVAALEPEADDKILEIGCGSGYAAAIMAEIVEMVYGIERVKTIAAKAESKLDKLGYENIEIIVGDGTKGYLDKAPFDGILVSAAAPEIPQILIEQLTEGGCMIIPSGNKGIQTLYQVKKVRENEIKKKSLGKVRFVPLIGEKGWD